ncbi:UPF0755 protein [Colwellia chukchiensis]|uniref:Endolytic murein transglycosylase n=1 Tax=Colwellia chukchiensis TaxID=641665 RepID=A0A1H7M738_9GAMM|nr:endolytic transglycosylase MltG [Colwellia chukchiensis]SEL06909.1 UPF0755 protein [Colwellia chukchiensis]
MKKVLLNIPWLTKRKAAFGIMTLLFVVLSTIVFVLAMQFKLQQPLLLKAPELITVKAGTSFNAFARQLVTKGWLENDFWLRSYGKLKPSQAAIKSGTYQVSLGANSLDLLQLIVSGKEHQFAITFIEGSTFKQALTQLAIHPEVEQHVTHLSLTEIANKLSIKQDNPEGWLFPDTYAFTKGTADLEILKRAYKKMQQALDSQWQQRAENLPYTSPYQALIMASIIEKESGKHAEHPRIASVFINRLNKNMRLQTDPTVIYGLGARFKGDITYAHLREKTPYNTYRIKGLPPTPIALPGAQALRAALHPEQSDYFYFVSNGAGEHIFSTNLADHNRAVHKYQRKKN